MNSQLLARRYRIIQFLGSGAFGTTYLAVDTRRPGNPPCVVKQLLPVRQSAKALKMAHRRFTREAQILEKLGKNDQIPQLLAYFEENQEFYLVEEFIPGHPLSTEFSPGNPQTEDQVGRLLQEILEILVFVHSHGVIHRDIKPANLIRRQPDGKLVLIDFGTVKEVSTQSSTGNALRTMATGTPVYMPLEQFQGNPQFNSDIYAIGMMAIQALTGLRAAELPSLKNGENSDGSKICWQQRAQVSTPLAEVIDKMIVDDYRLRYQSAQEVINDLKKIQSTTQTEEIPPTIIEEHQEPEQLETESEEFSSSSEQKTGWTIPPVIGVGMVTLMLVVGGILFFQSRIQIQAKEFYTRGVAKAQQGDLETAIKDLNQAIHLMPNYFSAYYSRGRVSLSLGDYNSAIADYTRAIELNPKDAGAYANRCLAHLQLSKFQDAIADCTDAIEINPHYADAYTNRGLAHLFAGQHTQALNDSNRAIEINPSHASAYYTRGLTHAATGILHLAIADYTRALEYNPNDARAYHQRGLVRVTLEDHSGAIADFQKAAQLCRSAIPPCDIDPEDQIKQLQP